MKRAIQVDQAWFVGHPLQPVYQRAPLPGEWQDVSIPQGAAVTVHFINGRCRARVLKLPNGQKVATAIDSEDDLYVED